MANGPSPQYPVMGGPSLQSVMGRHRMGIEDAMYAAERQRERQYDLAEKGAKGAYEYDKMLRGFMEAKYANPELTFWDYVSKPSVGAAFRKQGREKIAEATLAGEEIEGMGIGARHKAGLKGIFGRDRPKKVEEGVPDMPTIQKNRLEAIEMEKRRVAKLGVRSKEQQILDAKSAKEQKILMKELEKRNLERGEGTGKGARTTMEPAEGADVAITKKDRIEALKNALKGGKLNETQTAQFKQEIALLVGEGDEKQIAKFIKENPNLKKDILLQQQVVPSGAPVESLAKKQEIYNKALEKAGGKFKYTGPPIEAQDVTGKTVEQLFGKKPTEAGETVAKVFGEKSTQAEINAAIAKATKVVEARKAAGVAGEVGKEVTEAAGEEAVKGGLKATLGKAVGPTLSAAGLAGGLYAMKTGKTEESRIGGGIAAAGGAAGLIAATNFWNPVGWAAAIPAALSIGGGAVTATGGKKNRLGGTPLDRYRRRIGII